MVIEQRSEFIIQDPSATSTDAWTWQRLSSGVADLKRSRTFRGSATNATYSVAEYVAQPLLMIAATPFLVHRLGFNLYGIWMLVGALTGTVGIFSLGLGDATIKYVSTYRGRGDFAGVIRTVRGTLTISLLLGGITAAVVILGAPLLVQGVFKVRPADYLTAVRAFQIGGVVLFLRSLDSVLSSTLRGFEKYGPPVKFTVIVRVLTIASAVLLVAFGFGVVAIMLATLSATAIGVLLQAMEVGRVIPGISFWPTADRRTWEEIFGFGLYTWIQSIGAMIFSQVDRLLVGGFLGTAAVAYYTICVQLAQPIHSFVAAAFNFIFPHMSTRHETGERKGLKRVYRLAVAVNVVLVVLLSLPLLVFGKTILTLWMGADFAQHSYQLLFLLAVAFAVLAINVVPHFALLGLGKVRFVSLVNLAGGALSLTVAALLIPPLGLVGAAVGRLFYGPVITLNYIKAARIMEGVSGK